MIYSSRQAEGHTNRLHYAAYNAAHSMLKALDTYTQYTHTRDNVYDIIATYYLDTETHADAHGHMHRILIQTTLRYG